MLEKEIVKKIKDYLNSLPNTFVWKSHGNGFVQVGVPDLIGVHNGTFIGVEVKQPGKVPTKIQQAFIKKIRNKGGLAFLATSVGDVMSNLWPSVYPK